MAIMSIADALKAAIAEEMRRDPTVYCLGEDEDIPGGMGGYYIGDLCCYTCGECVNSCSHSDKYQTDS